MSPFEPAACPPGGGAGDACCPEDVELQELCDVQPDNSVVRFLRRYAYAGATGLPVAQADTLLDGVTPYAPTGTVGSCDPSGICTPSPNINLNGTCGPGQTPTHDVIANDHQANDATINDDPSADPLCGGQWARPNEAPAAPFPVSEPFRTNAFNDPSVQTYGSAHLTSGVEDPAGQGYLRASNNTVGNSGAAIFQTPFPATQGATAEFDWASYGGTNPGGDGMSFFLTDGGDPAQVANIPGGGSLGLQAIENPFVAIALDEFGGSDGGGFNFNRVRIFGRTDPTGAALTGMTMVGDAPTAPQTINNHPRSAMPKVRLSVFVDAGRTYVSAAVKWPGQTDFTPYFNRLDVTAQVGAPPATLRMGLYGGSGGAFQSFHEFRGLTVIPAGKQEWRRFPIVTDPVPPCATSVLLDAHVDVTITDDSQTAGNADNEIWFWLVDESTGTILDRAQFTSIPSQVGTVHHLDLGPLSVTTAQLANLRIYTGAETRDANGNYGSLWENLVINAQALGCPAANVRTIPVSAPCPLPVTIVGGSGSAPAPVTVVNTPSVFEDAPICMTVGGLTQPGFRREEHNPDGTTTITFIGSGGTVVDPVAWTPGDCTTRDAEIEILCDDNGPFLRAYLFDETGALLSSADRNLAGASYTPAGAVVTCPEASCPQVLGEVCVTSSSFPGVILSATAVQACDGSMTFINKSTGTPWPGTVTLVVCPPPNEMWEEVLCDQGNAGQPFRRVYNLTPLGSVTQYDEDFDTNTYVPVGPVGRCTPDALTDVEPVLLCDLPSGVAFLRRFNYSTTSPTVTHADTTLDGATPYVVAGTAGLCSASSTSRDVEDFVFCDSTPTRFLRRYTYNGATGAFVSITDTTLDGNTAFVPVGAVTVCSTPVATDFDFTVTPLCDVSGAGVSTPFLRRLTFNSSTGAVTATTDTTLAGAAYVTTGTVGLCGTSSPVALTAQHRLVAAADAPWTPGADVAGTLVSVTYTVLSGTATVLDQNGTSASLPAGFTASWSVEDRDSLGGPQSIDAIGGSTYVNWVVR